MNKLIINLLIALPCFSVIAADNEVIDQRQHVFADIENNSKTIEETLDENDIDWKALTTISNQLVADSLRLSHLFPADSVEKSKAKENIWEQPDKFEQLMKEMQQGYSMQLEGAENQDLDKVEQGFKYAQDTCRACHRTYRSRW